MTLSCRCLFISSYDIEWIISIIINTFLFPVKVVPPCLTLTNNITHCALEAPAISYSIFLAFCSVHKVSVISTFVRTPLQSRAWWDRGVLFTWTHTAVLNQFCQGVISEMNKLAHNVKSKIQDLFWKITQPHITKKKNT